MKIRTAFLIIIVILPMFSIGQDSNIIEFTPSKLLNKNQFDFKVFNNLYTETKKLDGDLVALETPRQYFFTNTIEVSYGISESRRLNIGLVANIKSNVFNSDLTDEEYNLVDVLGYQNIEGVSRAGITSIAPTIKFAPFKNIGNFSVQSGFFIPLLDYEQKNGVYLDRKSFVWDNKFFFDKTFKSKYQIFVEIDLTYFTGDSIANVVEIPGTYSGGFANNSLATPVSFFFSYFPNQKMTFYVMSQHYQLFDLGNNFAQDFTQSGAGIKYQISEGLNMELLYTNFWRGSAFTGLGETYNLGFRYLLN